MVDALVYTSRATPAFRDPDLERLLQDARATNARRAVTGALLRSGARIVQFLEGEAAALDFVLARIRASRLHADVRVLGRVADVPRCFDRWHLGFADFQWQFERREARCEWEASIAAARAQAAANPPLALLLAYWDAFTRDAPDPVSEVDGVAAG